MYLSSSFGLLIVLLLLQTVITETNGLLLLASIVFVVTFGFISYTIRELIKNSTKSSDNSLNNSLLLISVSKVQKPIIKLLTHCLNLLNKPKSINQSITNKRNIENNEPLFCGNCLDINNESKTFAKLITDNYVEFWYKTINGGNDDFITDCQIILQQIFINLYEKCEQKLKTEQVLQKSFTLLEQHLISKRSQINRNDLINETERVALIVERVLLLLAPEEVLCVMRNESSYSDNKLRSKTSHYLSLSLMIKDMLTQSVFIPITNIITDPKWIYSNIIWLCDLSNNYNNLNSFTDKPIDRKSQNENQSSNSNELTLNESELNITQEINTSVVSFQITNCLQYNIKSVSDPSINSLPQINIDSVEQISRLNSYYNLDLCLGNEEKGIKVLNLLQLYLIICLFNYLKITQELIIRAI